MDVRTYEKVLAPRPSLGDCLSLLLTVCAFIFPIDLTAQEQLDPETLLYRITQVRNSEASLADKVALLQQYQDIARDLSNDSIVAYCDHRIALSYFDSLDDAHAHDYYVRAFQARLKMREQIHFEDILRSGLYAGITSDYLGKPDVAKHYYSAIVNGNFPPHGYYFRAYQKLGLIYQDEGDYQRAFDCFEQAMLGKSYLRIDERFLILQDYLQLIYKARFSERYTWVTTECEQLLAEIGKEVHQHGNIRSNIRGFYQNLAVIYDELGNFGKSRHYKIKALERADSHVERIELLNSLCNLHRKIGDYLKAQEMIEEALEMARDYNDQDALALTHINLGDLALVQGQFRTAEMHFDSSLYFATGSRFDTITTTIKTMAPRKQANLLIHISDLARCYFTWYRAEKDTLHLAHALRYYRMADQVIDLIRNALVFETSQFHWRAEARQLYEQALLAAIEADQPQLALEFLDRSKAIVLTEALQRSMALRNIPDSLRNRRNQLLTGINETEHTLLQEEQKTKPDTLRMIRLADTLHDLQDAFARQQAEMHAHYAGYMPDYHFDLQAIQERLPEEQAILAYFLTSDTVLCARVEKDMVDFRYLGSRQVLDKYLREAAELMRQGEQRAGIGNMMSDTEFELYLQQHVQTFHALYTMLLGAWSSLPENLMIIADEQLHTLSFDMLLTKVPDPSEPLGRWPFAVRKHCFSYNHSLVNWQALCNQEPTEARLVGFAPQFNGIYAALPHSHAALARVDRYRTRILNGPEANRANLTAHGAHAILGFETHAVIAETYSGGSFIVLNKNDGSLDSLYLRDIYQLPLSGAFAVLTACETHVGNVERGEGVISLARAFTQAGASAMVTSLWKIDEYASSVIMSHFYDALAAGLPKDQALRRAKLAYLTETQSELEELPFYWAPLIVIGDVAPVPAARVGWYWLGAVFLLILLLWTVFHSAPRKSLRPH